MGGQVLKLITENLVTVPDSVWKATSAIFASNAKGEVTVFLRNPMPQSVFNTIEASALNLVNKINSSVVGRNATTVIPR